MSKIIGSNIKHFRTSSNLTQEDVASKLNMSRQRFARIENGILDISFEELVKISKIINVDVNKLTSHEANIAYRNNSKNENEINDIIEFFYANKHLYEKSNSGDGNKCWNKKN